MFVNKLTADIDKANSNIRDIKTVQMLRYTGNSLMNRDLRKMVNLVYRNFEELGDIKILQHNREEIGRLLTSPKSIIIIGVLDGKIISYLICEQIVYNNIKLMHINYLFTSPVHRSHGVASYMLNLIHRYAVELDINTLSLTYDTYNLQLTRFYTENEFTYDPEIRSFQRYDMMVKYL